MVWIMVSALTVALWCFVGGAIRPLAVRLGRGAVDHNVTERDQTGWLLGLSTLVALLALPEVGTWIGCTAVGVGVIHWLRLRSARAGRRQDGREQLLRGCGILAGQLAIGELPAAALKATAFDAPLFAPAAAAVTVGGDPVAALRTMAQQPGCDILMRLADSWQVCLRTGMPLGDTVSAVVQNVEREIEYEATREAELATTRTTGRMLAVLPLVGLLMGFAVGADPFAFITGSVFGQWCLLGACCFAGGGLIWTELLGDPDRLHAPEQRKSQRNIVPQLTAMLPGSRRRNTTWHLDSVVSPSEKAAEQAGFAATLELLAAVISAGLPLRSATSIVGEVIAGSLGKRLRGVWALTDIGFGDAAAWRSLQHHSLWGEVARQVAHSADSGAGLSLLLRRAASRHRDKMAANLMVQVRSIGAKAALPLVVCYLPAFLLVGVLPIIGSLVTEYF